jgi:hypothetical protein
MGLEEASAQQGVIHPRRVRRRRVDLRQREPGLHRDLPARYCLDIAIVNRTPERGKMTNTDTGGQRIASTFPECLGREEEQRRRGAQRTGKRGSA